MDAPAPEAAFPSFTKEERIRQLNDIDKSLNSLLKSAGLAIQTLAQTKDASPHEDSREAFKAASNNYLATLHSVDVRLRRQIYGLEEADIISAEKSGKKRDGLNTEAAETMSPENALALDIGWLNSRSGKVGREMEAELWSKSLDFLTKLEDVTGVGAGKGDTKMTG